MNELMLSTTERKQKKVFERLDAKGEVIETSTHWHHYPVGQVLSIKTEIDTRREWLSIFCDMCAPAFTYTHPSGYNIFRKEKRTSFKNERWKGGYGFNDAQFAAMVDCWTEDRFDAWFKASIAQGPDRIAKEIALWNDIETSLQKDDLGKEANGLQYLSDVYPWNPGTRKRQFIIRDGESDAATIKAFEGDVTTEEVISATEKHYTFKPKRIVDWVNNLGLSEQSKNEIMDLEFEKHPRYDIQVSEAKLEEPVLTKWDIVSNG